MNREELMAAMRTCPFDKKEVTVEGWGSFHVREISTDTVNKLNAAKSTAAEGDAPLNTLAVSAASVICDPAGELLFDPTSAEDVQFLAGMGWARLSKVIAAANGLGAVAGE